MARARPLDTYPLPQFVALYLRVATNREVITIPCTPTQAATMRGELYAFRRAAESNPQAARDLGIPLEYLRDVAFRIKPEGLEALHQSQMQTPRLIEMALGLEGGAVKVKTGAELALERLKSLGFTPQPAATNDTPYEAQQNEQQ